MASYNATRFTRQVLRRYRKEPPSLILHLYPTHFRFQEQPGNFSYDSPMKCFLEAIREQRLPTDLLDVLDEASVRYYEGCLIVEVHDHRSTPPPVPQRQGLTLSFQLNNIREAPPPNKAEIYRIVLGPNPATLWTDLGIVEKRWAAEKEEDGDEEPGWTEDTAVELEAIILARTVPPLCLDPSIQTSRVANLMLRATTPRPLKRKRFCGSNEGDDDDDGEEGSRKEREERERMMKIGDEGVGRGRGNAFSRLAFIQSYREQQNSLAVPVSVPTPTASVPTPVAITSLRLGGPSLSGASTPLPANSPPTPAGSQLGTSRQHNKKKHSTTHTESESTPAVSTPVATTPHPSNSIKLEPLKKLSKKALAALATPEINLDRNDPTLPSDPAEKERVLIERRKLQATKKRAEAKVRQNEKKKLQIETMQALAAANGGVAQSYSTDLQVGTSGSGMGASPGLPRAGLPAVGNTKYTWANGGQ